MYGDEGIAQSNCNVPPPQEGNQNYQQQQQPNFGFNNFNNQFQPPPFFNDSPFFGFSFHSPFELFNEIFGPNFDLFGM